MLVGVPKEIKNHEYRVGLTPESVYELTKNGHQVMVQTNAGIGIEASDEDYKKVGATIVSTPEEIFAKVEMIVKVKEPQPNECKMIREGQIVFTYLHLAADKKLTEDMMATKCIGIAYETVTDRFGALPLLVPMSQVAGRLATLAGTHYLQKPYGGRGMLIAGVPGTEPAKVTIIGAGVVGTNALQMAVGLGADVTILNKSVDRLIKLDNIYGGRIKTVVSSQAAIEKHVYEADLVVGAVLVAGLAAPKLVTKAMLKNMKKGSVIVDVSIDQGGCFETSRPTTHADPVYVVDDVIHYCVANMPGAVPRTSTYALNNATRPFVLKLANLGWEKALKEDKGFLDGLNVFKGKLTNGPVGESLDIDYVSPESVI